MNPKLRLKVRKRKEILRDVRNLRVSLLPKEREERKVMERYWALRKELTPMRRAMYHLLQEYGAAKFLACPARKIVNEGDFFPASYYFSCKLEPERKGYMGPERKRTCLKCPYKGREVYVALLSKKLEGKKGR